MTNGREVPSGCRLTHVAPPDKTTGSLQAQSASFIDYSSPSEFIRRLSVGSRSVTGPSHSSPILEPRESIVRWRCSELGPI